MKMQYPAITLPVFQFLRSSPKNPGVDGQRSGYQQIPLITAISLLPDIDVDVRKDLRRNLQTTIP